MVFKILKEMNIEGVSEVFRRNKFDPEITNSTGRSQPGIENYNLPATRTTGLNLSLTF